MSGTDSLLKLLASFDAAAVPYMIVGSYSSNFYGIPRMTKDFTDTVAVLQVQKKSLDWAYIEHWCAQHDTLDVLADAKAEASVIWEADELENGQHR